jgi:tight adherence protein B
MTGILVGVTLGLGILLVFDGLTRPVNKPDLREVARKLGARGAGGLAGAVVGYATTGWMIAGVAGAILGTTLPNLIIKSRTERDRLQKLEALAFVSARLRDSIRSGIGLQDAIANIATQAPSILAPDLQRLAIDLRMSEPQSAGEDFARRFDHSVATLFGSAISLSDRLGAGNASEILDSLAEATAAQSSTLREVKARHTRQRLSARVVAAVPIILLIAIRHSNPGYLEPFNGLIGQLMLAFAFCMIGVGYAAMSRMGGLERYSR